MAPPYGTALIADRPSDQERGRVALQIQPAIGAAVHPAQLHLEEGRGAAVQGHAQLGDGGGRTVIRNIGFGDCGKARAGDAVA